MDYIGVPIPNISIVIRQIVRVLGGQSGTADLRMGLTINRCVNTAAPPYVAVCTVEQTPTVFSCHPENAGERRR